MMEKVFSHLIDQLMLLPGIGKKTAQRLGFYILKMETGAARKIGQAIIDVKEKILLCKSCSNIAERDLCSICANPGRDSQKILVVEEPNILYAIEKTGEYRGLYHVLHGTYSPVSDGRMPERTIQGLVERLKNGGITEVIIATSPNIDGEATALYLAHLIRPSGTKVTRIACGIPVGADLEYADEVTLAKSLGGRREM